MFYQRWILACAAGEIVGIGVATLAAISVNTLVGEPQTVTGRLLVLMAFAWVGVVEGGALAAFQWRVLRTRLPRLRLGEWGAVTVAVAATGWIAGMAPSLFLNNPGDDGQPEPSLWLVLMMASLAGAAAGFCFGAAQWFVLRRHAERAGRWVCIHMPAWGLALAAIFMGATLPAPGWPVWTIVLAGVAGGLFGGLLLGAVTGLVARNLQPWVDEAHWSLEGKVCVVTGANSGLGYEIALGLARLGGEVFLLCRRSSEGERIRMAVLAKRPGADVKVVTCDLSDFLSVRHAADQVLALGQRLDVLIHNAGATFARRTLTAAGVEATLAVDVAGPFLLTSLLRNRIEICGGRVIMLTGIYQRKGQVRIDDLHFACRPYHWLAANNQAQKGRWLFTWELARRSPHLTAAAVHPGAVLTGAQARLPRPVRALIRTVMRPAFVRAEVGAIPVLRLAAQPDPVQMTGRFFDRCTVAPDVPDSALAAAFWSACEKMTVSRSWTDA